MNMSASPKTTRSRKGSLKDAKDLSIKPTDLSSLFHEFEERMKSFMKEELKAITDRLSNIENKISSLKVNCTRLDNDVAEIKEIVTKQQLRIESHEEKLRENNLVIHNIPEREISTGITTLKTDCQKVSHLCVDRKSVV